MPNPWYPGATKDPGVSAGYKFGGPINPMLSVVAHYTAGYNSRALIRDQGLAEFLIARDGTVWQFSEADAICWQAGFPYNGRGPGIEIEYRDEPEIFTLEARTACAGLVKWLNTEWGIPLAYYDDPDHPTATWAGFISHRSVIEDAAHHYDYWPQSDWDLMVPTPAPSPIPPITEEILMISPVTIGPDGTLYLAYVGTDQSLCVATLPKGKDATKLDQWTSTRAHEHAKVGSPAPYGQLRP